MRHAQYCCLLRVYVSLVRLGSGLGGVGVPRPVPRTRLSHNFVILHYPVRTLKIAYFATLPFLVSVDFLQAVFTYR